MVTKQTACYHWFDLINAFISTFIYSKKEKKTKEHTLVVAMIHAILFFKFRPETARNWKSLAESERCKASLESISEHAGM